MLSDVPNSGAADAPVPFLDQLGTQQLAAQLTHGGAPRVLVHNVISPNFGDLNARLDEMEAAAHTGKVAAFKVYTAWGPNGRGFALDDPAIGLPGDPEGARPRREDAHRAQGSAARALRRRAQPPRRHRRRVAAVPRHELRRVPRRMGQEPSRGRIRPERDDRHRHVPARTRRARRSAERQRLGRRRHRVARGAPQSRRGRAHDRQAAEARRSSIGCCGAPTRSGTDHRRPSCRRSARSRSRRSSRTASAIPRSTPAIKAQVLGLNAAKLFDLDVEATRCALATDPITGARTTAAHLRADGRPPRGSRPNGPTTRREMLQWLASPATRWTPL